MGRSCPLLYLTSNETARGKSFRALEGRMPSGSSNSKEVIINLELLSNVDIGLAEGQPLKLNLGKAMGLGYRERERQR